MTQRVNATLTAVVLLFLLFVAAAFLPLPYVTYSPGPTVDVLGTNGDREVIQVSGHQTYRDDGQLRMVTVYVTPAGGKVTLLDALEAWFNPEEAIYPYATQYPDGQTAEESDAESAIEMVSSQDSAIAAALRALDYPVKPVIEVLGVDDGFRDHRRRARRGAQLRGQAGRRRGQRRRHPQGRRWHVAGRHPPRHGLRLPLPGPRRHQPEHRRAQRRADVLPRHL
jgi:hypothetical protein